MSNLSDLYKKLSSFVGGIIVRGPRGGVLETRGLTMVNFYGQSDERPLNVNHFPFGPDSVAIIMGANQAAALLTKLEQVDELKKQNAELCHRLQTWRGHGRYWLKRFDEVKDELRLERALHTITFDAFSEAEKLIEMLSKSEKVAETLRVAR